MAVIIENFPVAEVINTLTVAKLHQSS